MRLTRSGALEIDLSSNRTGTRRSTAQVDDLHDRAARSFRN